MGSAYNPKVQSTWTLVVLAVISTGMLTWASHSRSFVEQEHYQEKMAAANLMQQATNAIKTHQMTEGVFIDHVNDPNETTLIGQKYSLITTDRGDLDAKLTVTNPNFAAVIIDMLKQLQIQQEDKIAITFTGSMPGANIAVLAACEILEVDPYIITSVGASMWGANNPRFTWLDMETFLYEQGIFSNRSFAASVGGGSDRGRRLSPRGRELLQEAIMRNDVLYVDESTLGGSIERRVALFDSVMRVSKMKVFLNVGGGAAALGHSINGRLIGSGVVERVEMKNYQTIGTMLHYGIQGVSVINIQYIDDIARDYGLPVAPVPMPEVGTGDVFTVERYNLAITWIAFLILTGAITVVGVRSQRRIQLADEGVEPDSLL